MFVWELSQGPYENGKVNNLSISSRSEERASIPMRKSFLYSLKAGDLGVCKMNPTKESEEV